MKKRTAKCTVIMTGPAASVRGGIRTVVNQYLSSEAWGDIDLIYIPSHVEGSILKKAFFFCLAFFRIFATCISRHVDIIHMHVSERGSFWRKTILLFFCKRIGIKTVLHHHGAEFCAFFENASPTAKARITKVIELADVNIVLSHYHYQMMISRFPQGKFEVLYNAVAAKDGHTYNPEATGIVFVGRLGVRKGIYGLLDVMEEIEKELPADIKFSFCGDGETEKVFNMVREKKLENRVEHLGWCTKEDLAKILANAMLLILPSYHEGLPMSLLEAMQVGIPCIASSVDAIPEVIRSGFNGILVEPGNLEQIKNALLQLVQNQNARMEIGKMAQKTVRERFSFADHIEKLKMLYAKLEDDRNA